MPAIPLDRRFRLLFAPLHTPERYYRNYKVVESLDLGRLSIYRQLRDAVAFAKGDVLDLGCGIGYVTAYLNWQGGARGVDQDASAIRWAKQRHPETRFEVGTVQGLLKRGRRFKAVVCVNVLEHLEDPVREALLRALPRLLKPGGRFVAVYDNMYHPLQLLSGFLHPGMLLTDPTHVHCWRPSVFRNLLDRHLDVLSMTPGNILSRFLPWTNSAASAHLYVCAARRKSRSQ